MFNSPLPYPSPFPFLMAAKSCCYLLYTSSTLPSLLLISLCLNVLSKLNHLLLLVLQIFPSLASWIHTSVLIIFIQMNVCVWGKMVPKLFPVATVRSRSPSSLYLCLPTSLLWSFPCLYIYIFIFILYLPASLLTNF